MCKGTKEGVREVMREGKKYCRNTFRNINVRFKLFNPLGER